MSAATSSTRSEWTGRPAVPSPRPRECGTRTSTRLTSPRISSQFRTRGCKPICAVSTLSSPSAGTSSPAEVTDEGAGSRRDDRREKRASAVRRRPPHAGLVMQMSLRYAAIAQLTTDLVSIPRSETETVPAGTTSLVDCLVTRYCYVVAHQTGEDRQG